MVLEATRTRLVTQDGGRGIRDPRGRVEAAVAFAFRPIFYAGHAAAPLTGHVHPTPQTDAWEAELARQAAEPAPAPEAPEPVAADDGWTRRASW